MRSSADELRVDCARWLLPVASPPVEDGALATQGGRVLAAGPRREVLAQLQGELALHEHGEAAILPGLVNCHAHLELTGLAGKVKGGGSLCGWLEQLIEAKVACTPEELRAGVKAGLAEAHRTGTALVADNVSPFVAAPGLYEKPERVLALVELLGFSASQADERWSQATGAVDALSASGVSAAMAPHSPYTVSEALLARCAGAAGPLSIHLAESAEEVEFLRTGNSDIRGLLESKGAWDEGFRPPGVSPVEYLDRLGLLGPQTIAVHLVQATPADIALLAARGASACLCPRSNRVIGVGEAPLGAMLAANLSVCLGTDSLASNDDLNLFREAGAAVSLGASPEQALTMATLWGAEALGRAELGALSPGRSPRPLLVRVDDGHEPFEAALEAGARGEARWLLEGQGQ